MHVNSHPHRSTEGQGMAARGDSNTKETWMLWDQKPEKKRVLRTERQLFTIKFLLLLVSSLVSLLTQARKPCQPFYFLRILYTKRRLWSQALLAATVETGNRNRCVTEAEESLGKIKFWTFPERVDPRILSLESVDYFGTSEHFSGRKKREKY